MKQNNQKLLMLPTVFFYSAFRICRYASHLFAKTATLSLRNLCNSLFNSCIL